jgi:hypothetical protein
MFWDWMPVWYVLGLGVRVVCFGTGCQGGMFWDWVPVWYVLGLGARVVCFRTGCQGGMS